MGININIVIVFSIFLLTAFYLLRPKKKNKRIRSYDAVHSQRKAEVEYRFDASRVAIDTIQHSVDTSYFKEPFSIEQSIEPERNLTLTSESNPPDSIVPQLNNSLEDSSHVMTVESPDDIVAQQHEANAESYLTDSPCDDFIVIYVIAKEGAVFASYDLLQAILATGMQYGAMNIFHFVEESQAGAQTLFSLASATEPGDFDLNTMGDFSCSGLTMFMHISRVSDPTDVFHLMLETAEQLAEDLNGELRAGPRTPWSDAFVYQCHQKILQQQKLS